MSVPLGLYKIFIEVAKCQSFSKASKNLYITQPAVSQAIMQLEEQLKARVFTRTAKGVILTREGELLYEYAHSAIKLIEAGEKKLLETQNLLTGELQIGVGDTISRYYLLPYLESFHKKYPSIKLKIINRTTTKLCNKIKAGTIDLAICNLPIEDSQIEVRNCMEVHDIFVGGKSYKQRSKVPLSFEELSDLPLIVLDQNSVSRRYVEQFMLRKGVKMRPDIELGAHDLLLEFAKIELGISCVIKEFSEEYLEKKELYHLKLQEEIPSRYIGACYLKSVPLSSAAMTFIEGLQLPIK